MTLTGITGGIGSGKSMVSRILRLRGLHVYDCDQKARKMMDDSERIRRALIDRWGEETYLENGSLNRKMVSDIIFRNSDERAWINSLVHSAIREDIVVWSRRKKHTERLFVESAILFESGVSELCDEIWIVKASKATCISRVKERSGLSSEEIETRMSAQSRECEHYENTDKTSHIILNDGNGAVLLRIDELLNCIKEN